MQHCAEHQRALYRELYDVTVHGKVGGLEVAKRMPTALRRFWFEQMAEDVRKEKEEAERLRNKR